MTAQLETGLDLNRKYTVEEFFNLGLPNTDEGGNPLEYELVRGEIMIQNVGPSAQHGDIVTRISSRLSTFAGVEAGAKRIGKAYSGAGCTLGNDSNVRPDVCFVPDNRIGTEAKGPISVAPDLVVEVNSPSDTTESIQNKIEVYQAAGVRLIWSVYMLAKFVTIYRTGETQPGFVGLSGELDGEDVIPSFRLPVKALFD